MFFPVRRSFGPDSDRSQAVISKRLQHGLRLEAIEAHEHVNHPAVGENKFVVDRVQLGIKGHLLATRALRHIGRLDEVGPTTESMATADVIAGPLGGRKG